MSERQKLDARFKAMKASGQLLDMKFSFATLPPDTTVEEVCKEVNAVLDAVEAGPLAPYRFNDSNRVG